MNTASLDSAPIERTAMPLKLRLYVMMFLQYFVQGSYLPVITLYLRSGLDFTPNQIGTFSSAISLGPLLTPFVIGQLVDRHFATERVLAFCHLAGGAIMLALFWMNDYWPIVVLGAVYSTLYIPSMMLTNSLTFHHLKDREREFPLIRLWGTIGFVAPAWWIEMVYLKDLQGDELDKARGIVLVFAGLSGLVMGLYSLTLPHTPPSRSDRKDLAPGKVLGLLRLRNFFVLVLISLIVAVAHKYFFVWNSPFLRSVLDQVEIRAALGGRISSIGQIAEVVVMAFLGFSIKRFGFKTTMLCGISAYALRCLLFAYAITIDGGRAEFSMEGWNVHFTANDPAKSIFSLIFFGQALHGFCFGCFLAAAYMYVDRVAPIDVRGSMQTFYGTFVIGIGLVAGGFIGGWVGETFETSVGTTTVRQQLGIASTSGLIDFDRDVNGVAKPLVCDWPGVWLTGAAIAIVAAIGFALLFPKSDSDANSPLEAAPT